MITREQVDQYTLPHEADTLKGLDGFLREKYALLDGDPDESKAAAYFTMTQALNPQLRSPIRWALVVSATSVLVDDANLTGDAETLQDAETALLDVLDRSPTEAWWLGQAHYNLGNAIQGQVDLALAANRTDGQDRGDHVEAWRHRATLGADLRRCRRHFQRAAALSETIDDPNHVGRALCNLANALDSSNRWLEAHEFYGQALTADPTNGNAAGNAASTLNRAIQLGLGPAGHLAALSNQYRAQAIKHREGTVRIAGPATAAKWDALPHHDTAGHLAHAPDRDPYTRWVAQHRLALAPVMEGVGTDASQFDDVTVHSYTGKPHDTNALVPRVFAELNVLKADFLAARHTVHHGLTLIDDTPFMGLHPADTGTYTETLDLAVYGLPISLVTLGGRAALDVLDKIAVATNDYLHVGDDPGRINFRTFWRAKTTGSVSGAVGPLRDTLLTTGAPASRLLPLAELADDLAPGGLYEAAQTLRHRSTHRLVRATIRTDDDGMNGALTTIGISALRDAAITSLRIARVAMLYLHALVAAHEHNTAPSQAAWTVQLPLTSYGVVTVDDLSESGDDGAAG